MNTGIVAGQLSLFDSFNRDQEDIDAVCAYLRDGYEDYLEWARSTWPEEDEDSHVFTLKEYVDHEFTNWAGWSSWNHIAIVGLSPRGVRLVYADGGEATIPKARITRALGI